MLDIDHSLEERYLVVAEVLENVMTSVDISPNDEKLQEKEISDSNISNLKADAEIDNNVNISCECVEVVEESATTSPISCNDIKVQTTPVVSGEVAEDLLALSIQSYESSIASRVNLSTEPFEDRIIYNPVEISESDLLDNNMEHVGESVDINHLERRMEGDHMFGAPNIIGDITGKDDEVRKSFTNSPSCNITNRMDYFVREGTVEKKSIGEDATIESTTASETSYVSRRSSSRNSVTISLSDEIIPIDDVPSPHTDNQMPHNILLPSPPTSSVPVQTAQLLQQNNTSNPSPSTSTEAKSSWFPSKFAPGKGAKWLTSLIGS